MTSSILANTPSASTPAPTLSGTKGDPFAALSQNYETFLKLLTTQLQNQDPLQPQDSAEFTKQLVTFSQVEQQISTNKKLDTLISTNNSGLATQALSYIDKIVEYEGSEFALLNGRSQLAVTLSGPSKNAQLQILDIQGNVVATRNLESTISTQQVTWDGRDANGRQLPDGAYVMNVVAKDAQDKAVGAVTRAAGIVTGVDMADGKTQIMLGGLPIDIGRVLSVRRA